jgi:hypothetical protein
VARDAGAEQQVSTLVPNPTRLIPPVAARTDPTWCCEKCMHVNSGNREACTRCRCSNPGYSKPSPSSSSSPGSGLGTDAEEVLRLAKEKNHPGLNRMFADAGTSWKEGKIVGGADAVRQALLSRGHTGLLRLVQALCTPGQLAPVATDLCGNYTIQHVLEAAHRLRVAAAALRREGSAPSEPSGAAITALNSFGRMGAAVLECWRQLVVDAHGVYVMMTLLRLSTPGEVVRLGEETMGEVLEHTEGGNRDAQLFYCTLRERLVGAAFFSSLCILHHLCPFFLCLLLSCASLYS